MKSGSGLLPGFLRYRDCAVLGTEEAGSTVTAVRSGAVRSSWETELLFARGENELLCQRAKPEAVSASILWPAGREDELPAGWTARLEGLCREAGIVLAQVYAAGSDCVLAPVLTLSFLGRQQQAPYLPGPGEAVVAIGHAGMSGAALLARAGKKKLEERYSQGFLEQAGHFWDQISLRKAVGGLTEEACYLYPAGEGGVLAALWYLADGAGLGFDLDLKKILIRQETVEISEFYRLNPYQMAADGMLLAVTGSPETLIGRMESLGLCTSVLGMTTGNKARILRNEEEIRYLDKPAQDELERAFALGYLKADGSLVNGGQDERKDFGDY